MNRSIPAKRIAPTRTSRAPRYEIEGFPPDLKPGRYPATITVVWNGNQPIFRISPGRLARILPVEP